MRTLLDALAIAEGARDDRRKYLYNELNKLDKDYATAVARIERAYLVAQILLSEGFDPRISSCTPGSVYVTVQQSDLPRVRQAIGRLKASGQALENGETQTVRVYLTAEQWPGVSIDYLTTLPTSKKCKINRVVVPAKTEYQLVCER